MRTRKMGDLVVVDVHLEVDDRLSIVEGHDIAAAARKNVIEKHPVLDVMTHIDPVRRTATVRLPIMLAASQQA